MAIKDLLPWNKGSKVEVLHEEDHEKSLMNLEDEMDRMWRGFFDRPFDLSPFRDFPRFSAGFYPNVDVVENDKEVRITVELPGMDEKDIEVSLANNILTIRGEKKSEKEEKGKRYYRVERSFGSFRRDTPLPSEVEEDQIEATFRKGVLTVNAPKSSPAITKRIIIKKE